MTVTCSSTARTMLTCRATRTSQQVQTIICPFTIVVPGKGLTYWADRFDYSLMCLSSIKGLQFVRQQQTELGLNAQLVLLYSTDTNLQLTSLN